MSPALMFWIGFGLLCLFAWYFLTDNDRLKRILGSVLTVSLVALCLYAVNPPSDVLDKDGKVIKPGKIQLGLDLKGGTSFLIRLVEEEVDITGPDGKVTKEKRLITPSMVAVSYTHLTLPTNREV